MSKTYFVVCSLQPRCYTAECFQLFHVIVEGPKGFLLLVAAFCVIWRGSWDPQSCPNFRLWLMPVYIYNAISLLHYIWTNKGSKRVILCKDVPFGGSNDVPQNFEWIGLSSVNDKTSNTCNLNNILRWSSQNFYRW